MGYDSTSTKAEIQQNIFRISYIVLVRCDEDDAVDYVMEALNFDPAMIAEVIKGQYSKTEQRDNEEAVKSFADFDTKHNILRQIIYKQTLNRLKKLESMIGESALISCIVGIDNFNVTGFEYTLHANKADMIQYLIKFKEIKNLHDIKNEDESVKKSIYRILHWMFIQNEDNKIIETALKELNLSDNIVSKFIGFKYPQVTKEEIERGTRRYDEINIVKHLLDNYHLEKLKKLISMIGDDNSEFIQFASKLTNYRVNALENAIFNKKTEFYKYLLPLPQIRSLYDAKNKENVNAIYRMLHILFIHCSDDRVVDEVFKVLELDSQTVAKYINFKYPAAESTQKYHSDAPKYETQGIIPYLLENYKLDELKKLISMIGDGHPNFIESVSKMSDYRANALELAIWHKKTEFYQYLLSLPSVTSLYDQDTKNKNEA